MILDLLGNMLFFVLVSLPLIIFIRIRIMKNKEKDNKREFIVILFIAYLVGIASQTILPDVKFSQSSMEIIPQFGTGLNLQPFLVISQTKYEVFVNGNINYFLINFLGNILIFMPLGFLLPFIWKKKFIFTSFIGFSISAFIEFVQLFIARGSDVDDLMLNTLGTILGYMVFRLYIYVKKQISQ